IHEENRKMLCVLSPVAGIMFFLLSIVSTLSNGFATVNSSTYLVCGIVMLGIILCANHLVPKHPALVMVLVYLFEIVLYVFSIRISMLHAEKPAVSAVAFLLVTPMLFYDRPVRLSALITVDVVVFCAIAYCTKQPEVVETDLWNMVTFGIVAVATTMLIMNIKVQTLAQAKQIDYMSQTDLLTGLKNRNHFEKQLNQYPEMYQRNLFCVYGDANGLHELNNTQGHLAGDRMLREVAATMQRYFGPEHTYRVGGDEFVAFRMDDRQEIVSAAIDRMGRNLADKGYFISFGISVREKVQDLFDMHEIVSEAEKNMYAAKRKFYGQPENSRRSR
ncbi:MAG: GGDEF domain-containing protein, partial [Oscillospiraceae bacterium]|nr:GGDEF domain-containing protein [Oscillospiraceae bacterium]